MLHIYRSYTLGDMQAVYLQDDRCENLELLLLPAGMTLQLADRAAARPDSLVQLHIAGDVHAGHYASGRTMRLGHSAEALRPAGQQAVTADGTTRIITTLTDPRGYEVRHELRYQEGKHSLRSRTVFVNRSESPVELELLTSFSLGPLSPWDTDDTWGNLLLHRIRSVWSMEGRVETIPVEDLQLEGSWSGHGVRAERFGQVGSMPVNGYFPFIGLEDTKTGVVWGAQLAHNASWQMEAFRHGPWLYLDGGLADRELGHWSKCIRPGEEFTTPEAILTVYRGMADPDGTARRDTPSPAFDAMCQRLTADLLDRVEAGPASEQELPVMFNEYCTTWGDPSADNIREIVDTIAGKGFAYFVIDAGWYRQPGIPWDAGMGDYLVSRELFPEGLEKTVDYIKAHGMKPGLWFEIENVAPRASVYGMEEHLLKRDGRVLTTDMRRFLDMRDPWVQGYLGEKVIGTLKRYGFEYMKMDYNDSVPLGCDEADSPANVPAVTGDQADSPANVPAVTGDRADYPANVPAAPGDKADVIALGSAEAAASGARGPAEAKAARHRNSPGEGLRQQAAASLAFVQRVKAEIPGIILENCSSGGHRLEPLMMGECAMASFSDAHECREIPIIAAQLHRVILPRQSQIWAVIRETDSRQRIAYSLANTFLGRCCISGDVWKLSEAQWEILDRGLAFYRSIAPVIRDGRTCFFGPKILSWRHPVGWQGILRVSPGGQAFVLFTVFPGAEGKWMEVTLPEGCSAEIMEIYSDIEPEIRQEGRSLRCLAVGEFRNIAIRLG